MRDVLSFDGQNVVFGNDDTDALEFWDMPTGLQQLLDSKRGKAPQFPEVYRIECIKKISAIHPEFFDKPFVSFHLRKKGVNRGFTDYCRNPDTQETYIKAITYLTQNGFHVVGCGETDHHLFSHISGYYSLTDCGLNYDIQALFCLMKCCLLVGQQSSPLLLTSSIGTPTLITDAFPLCMGTFNKEHILLFKRIFTDKKEILPIRTVIEQHEDLFFGYGYKRLGYTFCSNTEDEILSAVQEALDYHVNHTKTLTPSDRSHIEKFINSYPKTSPIYYQKNRPVLFQIKV
jgi:putative glycosyltransferase (TIGR04372 family)